MDTKTTNTTLPPMTEEALALTDKAWNDLKKGSTTSVLCPRCKTHPKMIMGPNGCRCKIKCECGYIYDAEVYL